jgi:hypothetical protein
MTYGALPGLVSALELGEGFDLAALTTHGIDPKVSDYFRSAARFREGVHVVGLRANGAPSGLVDARFDAQGQLFYAGVAEKAGLVKPAGIVLGPARLKIRPVMTFLALSPQRWWPRPGSDEVALVVKKLTDYCVSRSKPGNLPVAVRQRCSTTRV